MAMRIQVLEVRLGDGSLRFGRQWKEAQKEEQQSIMISLGVPAFTSNPIRGCGSLVGVRDSLLTKNGPGWMMRLISIERRRRTKAKIAY
jgi:hypothetical protein